MGELSAKQTERAEMAPWGKELSALCRLRIGTEILLEISVPSILPYFIAIGHGVIWWFSEVSPHQHPSPNGATLFTEEG